MKIFTLMENYSAKENLECGHGLSFFIETENKNIVFDMGPDSRFMDNAKNMGIDLALADFGVLSHGHYDHGGGLKAFIEKYPDKSVYINKYAFGKHFVFKNNMPQYIGIDTKLMQKPNIILTDGIINIDDNIKLFSNVTERRYFSEANKALLVERQGEISEDDFKHEQYLLIKEGEKDVLISGCAHCGIVNIIEKAKSILGKYPDFVFSGFHLFNPTSGVYESDSLIEDIGECLKKTGAKFFTCHCTGKLAYEKLKNVLNESVEYVSAGDVVEI